MDLSFLESEGRVEGGRRGEKEEDGRERESGAGTHMIVKTSNEMVRHVMIRKITFLLSIHGQASDSSGISPEIK